MDYVLTTSGLCKQYGRTKALNGLDMHVPKGSIYGFVGKNGAGKTTLIRLICGLQFPSAGSFQLYGRNHSDREIDRARRRMGAVVETPAIYGDLSAADNLRMQSRVLGLPSEEAIPELLELTGLSDTGRKKARNFSLGMRQRLGIAMALTGDPDFLVLDEPVNGLDPQGIVEMRELILKLNRQQQITILISSHMLDELSRLATWYGFIDGGRLVKEISARDLEASCRKCLRMVVSDAGALARVLDEAQVEYRILSDREADVYAHLKVSSLSQALAAQGCELISIQERDESLESYYMNLVGGART